jgi:hypothetical protein
MDIAPPNQHPATSDDELAKVLAGIGANDSPEAPAAAPNKTNAEAAGLQFEETPGPMPAAATAGATNVNDAPAAPAMPAPEPAAPVAAPVPVPAPMPASMTSTAPALTGPAMPAVTGDLDNLKKTALEELRPLVGKLNLPPEEKFDTLLLIIRSTDDQSLLAPAHEAAQGIQDENKRAQALLDVIKEIDYFSQGQQPPAIQ